MSSCIRRARTRRAGLAAAAVLASATLAAVPALAAPSDYTIVDRPVTAGVTSDVLPTTQIDGVAWDQKIAGNTVYVGGEFTNARPAGAAAGTNLTPRRNLLAYDLASGELKQDFQMDTNAAVNVLALSPDGSRLYVGGAFTSVGGQNRFRIAAINTADGSLVASFQPDLDASVNSIVVTERAVYVGGVFSRANGVARTRLAAFSPEDGSLLGWAPTANRNVKAMTTTPDKSRIIIGGQFSLVNGYTSPGTASLDATNGDLYSFDMNRVVRNGTDNTGIYSLSTDGKVVTATAFNYGEGKFEGVAMADPYTGGIKWLADCHGDSYDSTIMGGTVYAVSHEHNCENIGSFPQIDNVTFKRATAFTYDATGTVRTNLQSGYTNFAGYPATSQINWYPELNAGSYTGMSQAAWTSESTDKYLVLGGEFTKANGIAQQGLVRFAVPGTSPSKDGPVVGGADMVPTATVRGTSATLSWKASWDRDNKNLTYRVYRSDKPDTPLTTIKADSLWWDRPTLRWTDTTMEAGKDYAYWVFVEDADGNRRRGDNVRVTAGAAIPSDSYLNAVAADSPLHLWRLDESRGSTAADSVGDAPMSLGLGTTLNQAGILSGNTATGFSGSLAGWAASTRAEAAPSTYTAEAWIRTTTTSGGVVMDFGNSNGTLDSSTRDRHVYMTNGGQLAYALNVGGTRRAITTPGAYNDGKWHHVATTLSGEGMKLYVDGTLQASNASWTAGQRFTGYWRLGKDAVTGLPNQPWSRSFGGTIDEAAVYDTALGADAIRAHALAGGATPANTAPVASFTATCDAGDCSVDASASKDAESAIASYQWDFGDGTTATGATAKHTYATSGTRTITLTVTDDLGATTTTSRQVSVALPNKAPVAAFTATPAGMDVTFDASESTDDGRVERYEWDFGDGSTGTGMTAQHSYATAGTRTVSLTVTDDAGTSTTTTRQVTVLSQGAVAGQDGFAGTRTRWGTAEVGGDWTYPAGGSLFSTADGTGLVKLGAGQLAGATLAGATGTDTVTTADVTIDKTTSGGGVNVMLAGRRVGTTDYRAKLRLLSDGSARIGVSRVVNGAETVLKEVVVAGGYAPGQVVHVKLELKGTGTTTVVAKAWTGDVEPQGGATVTDSTPELQRAGSAGLVAYASGSATTAPFTVGIDNLTVVRTA